MRPAGRETAICSDACQGAEAIGVPLQLRKVRCRREPLGPLDSPDALPGEELPGRVIALFGKSAEVAAPPRREHGWKWKLPEVSEQPERISVTDFAAYLKCPFRYYLTKVLKYRDHDPEQREMDAMQFGILVHDVLERYGKETPQLSGREEIASAVLASLEREISDRFGADPSPAVRVQAEAARVRLLSFAAVQAEQVAQGWRIVEVERKSSGDLLTGDSSSAKIDRIEVNGDRVRVLDYKTYSTAKSPEEVHLQPLSRAFLPEAETSHRGKPKAWVDLQLPLYRRIAETLFPGKTVETGYFVLAADPEESEVMSFDLTGNSSSALSCAEATASAIGRGVFWPPRQVPGSWEDPEGIFLGGGKPEECLDPGTIEFLKGRKDNAWTSRSRHTMLVANAGSGKTYALTTRMVRLLALGVEPRKIAALTFHEEGGRGVPRRGLPEARRGGAPPRQTPRAQRRSQLGRGGGDSPRAGCGPVPGAAGTAGRRFRTSHDGDDRQSLREDRPVFPAGVGSARRVLDDR